MSIEILLHQLPGPCSLGCLFIMILSEELRSCTGCLGWFSPEVTTPAPYPWTWASLQQRRERFSASTGRNFHKWCDCRQRCHLTFAPRRLIPEKRCSGPAWDRPDKHHEGFWVRWTAWSSFCWASSAFTSRKGSGLCCLLSKLPRAGSEEVEDTRQIKVCGTD